MNEVSRVAGQLYTGDQKLGKTSQNQGSKDILSRVGPAVSSPSAKTITALGSTTLSGKENVEPNSQGHLPPMRQGGGTRLSTRASSAALPLLSPSFQNTTFPVLKDKIADVFTTQTKRTLSNPLRSRTSSQDFAKKYGGDLGVKALVESRTIELRDSGVTDQVHINKTLVEDLEKAVALGLKDANYEGTDQEVKEKAARIVNELLNEIASETPEIDPQMLAVRALNLKNCHMTRGKQELSADIQKYAMNQKEQYLQARTIDEKEKIISNLKDFFVGLEDLGFLDDTLKGLFSDMESSLKNSGENKIEGEGKVRSTLTFSENLLTLAEVSSDAEIIEKAKVAKRDSRSSEDYYLKQLGVLGKAEGKFNKLMKGASKELLKVAAEWVDYSPPKFLEQKGLAITQIENGFNKYKLKGLCSDTRKSIEPLAKKGKGPDKMAKLLNRELGGQIDQMSSNLTFIERGPLAFVRTMQGAIENGIAPHLSGKAKVTQKAEIAVKTLDSLLLARIKNNPRELGLLTMKLHTDLVNGRDPSQVIGLIRSQLESKSSAFVKLYQKTLIDQIKNNTALATMFQEVIQEKSGRARL